MCPAPAHCILTPLKDSCELTNTMYVSADYDTYLGQVVGSGQCVDYVKVAANAPATNLWSEGPKVRNAHLLPGTAIATFQNGKYQNLTNGDSHAAIFLRQVTDGIFVNDQWAGQPVSLRLIRFKGGQGTPNNDGDAFSVVE